MFFYPIKKLYLIFEENVDSFLTFMSRNFLVWTTERPALRVFLDLEKTVLHETRVSGTVLWSPTSANSPTYMYISQKTW